MGADQTKLSRDQWAWEFLRRNPLYQTDYQQFIAIWHALEANYGAPPNRDFQRWKRDARAYGPLPGSSAGDQPDTASGDRCVGEDERIFLECWMGAKWGFNKFPLDPHRSLPPPPEELSWRTPPARHAHDIDEAYRLDIAFDLSLPLLPQLDAAKFRLASRVAELRRAGHAAPHSVTHQRDYWTQLIGALDTPASAPETLLAAAQKMAESGYREILRLAG
ncbi:MAG: DUF6499 domain-containing protein [Thiobacillaceae bacterium]